MPREVVHTDNDPNSSRGGCLPVCLGPAATPKWACLLTDLRTDLSCQPNLKSPVHKLPYPVRPLPRVKAVPAPTVPSSEGLELAAQPSLGHTAGQAVLLIVSSVQHQDSAPTPLASFGSGPGLFRRAVTLRGRHQAASQVLSTCGFLPVEGMWGAVGVPPGSFQSPVPLAGSSFLEAPARWWPSMSCVPKPTT